MSYQQRQRFRLLRQNITLVLLLGDALVAYLALVLAFCLRFNLSSVISGLHPFEGITFAAYQPLFLLGVFVLLLLLAQEKVYDWKILLRPKQMNPRAFRAIVLWFFGFLFISLTLRIEPVVSRAFVFFAAVFLFLCLVGWRRLLSLLARRTNLARRLGQKILFVGWNREAAELAESIEKNDYHPYEVGGWIAVNDDSAGGVEGHGIAVSCAGHFSEFEAILDREEPDLLVVADLQLHRDHLAQVIKASELRYLQLKIFPSMFQIFISGLRLETISNKPLLGVEEMAIESFLGRFLKRTIDIVGSVVGLVLSSPVILLFAYLIKREDPGPAFFSQERIGRQHRPFQIYKLRSMKMGSDLFDSLNQSTLRQDPRVLRLGAFMRKYNIDELPQFWNVLKGEMSLVGPRPERTHFVGQLSEKIEFYNNRHLVKPGMTGWAQINGYRGDTDLSIRIRYDIYYIENWSLWMDLYCLARTFFARKNAY